VIRHGDLYRIGIPGKDDISAAEYVRNDRSEAVAFAFLHTQTLGRPAGRIKLQGLDPARRYRLADGECFWGSTIMNLGIPLTLSGDYDSEMFWLRAE